MSEQDLRVVALRAMGFPVNENTLSQASASFDGEKLRIKIKLDFKPKVGECLMVVASECSMTEQHTLNGWPCIWKHTGTVDDINKKTTWSDTPGYIAHSGFLLRKVYQDELDAFNCGREYKKSLKSVLINCQAGWGNKIEILHRSLLRKILAF